ncbi:hypothetical protein JCM3774_004223 [Rhodotorula dairenensis]
MTLAANNAAADRVLPSRRQNACPSASPHPDPLAAPHTDLSTCASPIAADRGSQERAGPRVAMLSPRSDRDALRERVKSDDAENSSRSSSKQSLKCKADSGEGGGNETDVEDEDGEADDSPMTADDVAGNPGDVSPPSPPGTAMYPFPTTELHRLHRPPSNAEMLLSSATSSSSLDASDREEGDDRRQSKRRHSSAWPGSPLGPHHRPGAVPPRARRIGALGISVHSDSDPDNPNVSGLDSCDRRVEHTGDTTSDTRATDLGVSSGDLRQLGAMSSAKPGSARCKTVAEATCRGVVDELAEQNRMMRARLKRYEAGAVPLDLKRNRLFEIRFFEGLPPKRRTELEEFLAAYVQTLANDDGFGGPDAAVHAASVVPPQMRDEFLTRANLAGPSDSGPEPQSFSGTGTGMRLPPSQPHLPTVHVQPSTVLPITSPTERAKALQVVRALEDLFEHSLERASKPDLATTADAASNEVYFAHLLSTDYLSRRFVYLNLALTMAQIHRYNVTVNFVKRAIAQFSKRLELSPDGSRVRWKVANPLPPSPSRPALTEASVVANAAAAGAQPDSGDALLTAKARLASTSGETDSRSGSGSGTGSSAQQPGNLLAKSVAQSASTAPTSVPSSGRASLQQQQQSKRVGQRPRRPTAAVLQPMHYFGTEATVAAPKMPTAPAALGNQSHCLSHTIPLPSPVNESVSSTGSAGQALSATNLREHDRLQAHAARTSSRRRRSGPPASNDTSRNVVSTGAGTMVFYKSGDFCTDLTTELEPVSPPALPSRLVEAERNSSLVLGLGGDEPQSSSPETGRSAGGFQDVEMSTSSNDECLKVLDGHSRSAQSGSDSHTSSLARLQASGMTEAIPADLFTIVVKTRQVHHKRPLEDAEDPLPATQSSVTSPGASAFPFFSVPPKRPRYNRNLSSLEITSTEEIYHEAKTAERNALELFGLRGDSSPDGAGSPEEWSYGQELTRSNLSALGRNADQVFPSRMRPVHVPRDYSIMPSPPHDDYLISLAAPSHAWAPVESGFHSSGRSVAPAADATVLKRRGCVTRVHASTTNGSLSTGDERPISLDEMVELPRARLP